MKAVQGTSTNLECWQLQVVENYKSDNNLCTAQPKSLVLPSSESTSLSFQNEKDELKDNKYPLELWQI